MNRQTVRQAPSIKPVTLTPARVLQRTCACGQHTSAGGECEACRKKREATLQRSAISAPPVGGVPPIVHEVLHSPGQPLDGVTRAFMEPRFDYDFSRVRVHTDAVANKSAQALDALAYTTGNDIVFSGGFYNPQSSQGLRLLGHELAHVIQQNEGLLAQASASGMTEISSPVDRLENEADAAADYIMQAGLANSIERSPISDSGFLPGNNEGINKTSPPGLYVQYQKRGTAPSPRATRKSRIPRGPARAGKTEDPSCMRDYGKPGTVPTRKLVDDKANAITRMRTNLISWKSNLLDDIHEIVNELYQREGDQIWFATFATKVIGEFIGTLGEEFEPVKLLITGLAEIGEHVAEQNLEAARKELADKVKYRLQQERDELRKNAEVYINDYFERIRGRNEPGCGVYLDLLYQRIERWWPQMTAPKLKEAKRLVEQIIEKVRYEALQQHLRKEYEECLRLELKRPGGIPTKKEEDAAAEKCRAQTGYPV